MRSPLRSPLRILHRGGRVPLWWLSFALVVLAAVAVAAHDRAQATDWNPGYGLCLDDAATGVLTVPMPIDQPCDGNTAFGAPSDMRTTYGITAPAYNFDLLIRFSPAAEVEAQDANIPLGAVVGRLGSKASLGLLGNPCSNLLDVYFTLFFSSLDVNDTIIPKPRGQANQLEFFAIDDDNDGLPNAVEKYPEYLKKIFDPDYSKGPDGVYDNVYGGGDDVPGPQPPLQPIARATGFTIPAGTGLQVVINFLAFPPGTSLVSALNPDMPPFVTSLGYPSVVIVQDPTVPLSPSAVSDWCSPFDMVGLDFGLTRDNPCTPPPGPNGCQRGDPLYPAPFVQTPDAQGCDAPGRAIPDPDNSEGGCATRRNPSGTHTSTLFERSQRDADDDGIENALDTCAFAATVGLNPRAPDVANDPDGDGIPGGGPLGGCDPAPNTRGAQSPPNCLQGNTGPDTDQDCYSDRQDNCPIDFNTDQKDQDNDRIGDVCDQDPTTASGHHHEYCVPVTFTYPGSVVGTVGAPYAPPCGVGGAPCDTPTITGTTGNDVINGTNGNDVIDALAGHDIVYAFGGNDIVCGGPGFDSLYGYGGNDALYGQEDDDQLYGYADDDVLNGGSGTNDSARYDFSDVTGSVNANLQTGIATGHGTDTIVAVETLIGSASNDLLTGDGGPNFINGSLGEDSIDGGGGNDRLLGDLITGVGSNDSVKGGGGDDTLSGGPGNDILDGGADIDTADYSTPDVAGPIQANLTNGSAAGQGSDQLMAIENLLGSKYGDALTGDSGVNSIDGGLGSDTLDGAGGNDVLFDGASDGNTLIGGGGADALTALVGQNTLDGGPGDDTLSGGGWLGGGDGTDTLKGGFTSDVLGGGAGNDSLDGGHGYDLLDGGPDIDTCDPDPGMDTLVNCETIFAPAVEMTASASSCGASCVDALLTLKNISSATPIGYIEVSVESFGGQLPLPPPPGWHTTGGKGCGGVGGWRIAADSSAFALDVGESLTIGILHVNGDGVDWMQCGGICPTLIDWAAGATFSNLLEDGGLTVACGPDADGDGVNSVDEGQCADAVDGDLNRLVNDGCPQIGATAESGAQCSNVTDDDADGRVNDGCPGASETLACGSNPIDPSSRPERRDGVFAGLDDDGDTQMNEVLPDDSEIHDCDGDGWKGNQEALIYLDAPSTLHDQDPCGNNGWPADLTPVPSTLTDYKLNIADFTSFIFPLRDLNGNTIRGEQGPPPGGDDDGHGVFNMFGHPLDDDGDTLIEPNEDPPPPGGATYNVARWNIDVQFPITPATMINIGDLNALNPAVNAPTSHPPMFGSQPAFFTNLGQCPWPP